MLADRSPLNLAEKRTQKQIAEATLVAAPTVCQICRRFALEGLEDALTEKPRPGALPKITGETEAQLCLLACSDQPTGYAHGTLVAAAIFGAGNCFARFSSFGPFDRLARRQSDWEVTYVSMSGSTYCWRVAGITATASSS